MTAYNVVRMRVKPGREQEFLELHKSMDEASRARMRANGFRHASIVKTGERAYCFLGEWESMDAIVKSRPDMIQQLDRMRDMLEDLGHGLGVTDPVSGESVWEIR
jgi:quinol monooxygenase YgiN